MTFQGRYKVRNGLVFAVHVNPMATKGDREIRYKGHSIGYNQPTGKGSNMLFELVAVWNENGECVSVQGVVDNTSEYDLMQGIDNKDSYSREREIRVIGCKECEK